MSVSLDDVRHIAALARLGLDAERAQAMTAQLNTILQHMDVLSRVDTRDVEVTIGGSEAGLPLRPDHGPPLPLDSPPEAFAPSAREGFLLVPRLSTHEDVEDAS